MTVIGPAAGTYSIIIDSYAVQDLDGNDMMRQESASVYTFEMGGTDSDAPVLVNSLPEDSGMFAGGNISLTFSEPVVKSSTGYVDLFDCGHDMVCDATDPQIARYMLAGNDTNSSACVTEGNMAYLTIDSVAFEIFDNRRYKLVIPAGAFQDAAANAVGRPTSSSSRIP